MCEGNCKEKAECPICSAQADVIPFTEDDIGYSNGDYDKFLTDDQRQYK